MTEWRQSDPHGSSVPANLQRWTLKRLDQAYQGFFGRVKKGTTPGFPRFRGKGRFATFGFHEFRGIRFKQSRIRFKGMPGGLRVHLHRPLPDGHCIKCCVFSRDVRGWTVGFVMKVQETMVRPADRMVGLDLGIITFAALSDGGFIPSFKAARRAQRRLRIAQRSLARKTSGSRGRRKARTAVARCHASAARARANHLHHASARLVRDYDVIVFEKLNVKGLARSPLARDIHDVAFAKFISMLRYKAACAGVRLIEVNPFNTSQECSRCGITVRKQLAERIHACTHCGFTVDRDLNAARNILHRAGMGPGLRNVAGYGVRASGNLDEVVGT